MLDTASAIANAIAIGTKAQWMMIATTRRAKPRRRRSLTIAIAVNDFSPALIGDRALFGRQFVGVGFVVHMVGEVLPQARQVLLEIAQSQMLVQAAQLPLGIGDQILIAQFVEA